MSNWVMRFPISGQEHEKFAASGNFSVFLAGKGGKEKKEENYKERGAP